MPYLLGTPAPYARALLKKVFKLVPAGPPSVEIIQLGDGTKAKLRTRTYRCADSKPCGYAGFRLLTTAKDNRVVGGMSNFDMGDGSERNAVDSGKLFRLLAGASHLQKANDWLTKTYRSGAESIGAVRERRVKGQVIGTETFGHARISISKGKIGSWTLTVQLP